MSPVRLEQQDALAWLHIQRPEAYNAFTRQMAGELLEYLFSTPTGRIGQGSGHYRRGICVFSRRNLKRVS